MKALKDLLTTINKGAPDHMTRLQWISALHLAADHSGAQQSYQRLQAAKRRQQRQGLVQEMIQARLVPTFVFIYFCFHIIACL